MKVTLRKTLKQFLAETTLHGFKYLRSPFFSDWLAWMLWICACSVCGGILCTVLWARYLDSPTMLVVVDPRNEESLWFPAVAICPSPQSLAQRFQERMLTDDQHNVSLPTMFHNLLRGRPMTQPQAMVLERALTTNNLTLRETLVRITEPCDTMIRFCRLRDRELPCEKFFEKDVTPSGACCIAMAHKLNRLGVTDLSVLNPTLDLHLRCSDESIPNGCEFITMYPRQGYTSPVSLINGYIYKAHMKFTLVKDSSKGKLFDGKCSSQSNRRRKQCFDRCKERKCGCSDPLATMHDAPVLPPCTITRLRCLKSFKLFDEEACKCPVLCDRISVTTLMESSPVISRYTLDPLYDQVNSSSVILSITTQQSWSNIFDLRYTETWWSLLSSLGGVFNMFLGVGAISVLELVFWLVKPVRPQREDPAKRSGGSDQI